MLSSSTPAAKVVAGAKQENNKIKVTYDNAKAVTPGQFCVLYDGDLCLGGGIIEKVF